MKNCISFIKLIVFVLVLATSCETEPFLNVISSPNITFAAGGGTQSITFSTNRDWSVSSTEPWVKVSPSSGPASEGIITITLLCEENTSYDVRTATLTINAENVSEQLTVSQDFNLGLFVTPTTFDLSNASHYIEVAIKSNVNYSVDIDDSCKTWISLSTTKSLTEQTLAFDIAANETYDTRTGKITIKQNDGTLKETIIINQGQTDEILISTTEYKLSNEEQQLEIEVNSNVEFTVSSDVEWIRPIATKGLTTSAITLNIDKNETYDDRTGHIEIKQNLGNKSAIITVYQETALGLFISLNSLNISREAQTQCIDVMFNTDFDIIIPESDQSWISTNELPATKALGTKTIEFDFSENPNYQPRASSIIFMQRNGALSDTLNVIQAQTDIIIPEKSEFTIESIGGQLIINYEANVSVSYEINSDWISISEYYNSDSGALSIEVSANPQNDRTAEILLYGGDAKATILIEQAGLKDGDYMSLDYGLLSESLNRVATDTITTVTIYGKINDEDFKMLNQLPKLTKLDLTNATCYENTIPNKAFMNNETLTHIDFGDNIEIIGESAFRNCENLSLPKFSQNLKYIYNYAFYGNQEMKGQLNFPSTFKYIGDYAFCSCTGICGDLLFPDQMENIGEYAFSGCTGLDGRLTFPTTQILYIKGYAFNACRNFTGDLVLPSNVYLYGGYTFNEAGFTGSVYADVAGWYTFYECKIGENLIVSDDIESLNNSFRDIHVNGYIYIGKSMMLLDGQTFYSVECDTYYVAAPVPPTCGDNTSINLSGAYLGVPIRKKAAYEKAEYWKEAAVIEEVNFSELKLKP